MTDRDDALRRDLGWTGPEETDFEPPADEPEPGPPPPRQVPLVLRSTMCHRHLLIHAEEDPGSTVEAAPGSRSAALRGRSSACVQGGRRPERQLSSTASSLRPAAGCAPRHRALPVAEPRRRHTVEPAAGLAAAPPWASTHAAWPTTATTGSAVAPRRICTRHPRGPTAERFLRGSDPGRRPGSVATRSPESGLALCAVQGHLRIGEPGAGTGRGPAGPARGEDQDRPPGALQGRRDGQGRSRKDHGGRQHRIGFRRAAPGRPRGGDRRRYSVREVG